MLQEPHLSTQDWRAIIRQIKRGKCTPLISNQIINDYLFREHDLVHAWANEINYPLNDKSNLTRVAQFLSITSGSMLLAKDEYLDFLKQDLLETARSKPKSPEQTDFLDTLEGEMFNITFSEVAARLGYLNFEDKLNNPLRILAELPLPIYLTTSYHNFVEAALRAAGKEPVSEICYWHDELEEDIPSIFDTNPNFQPSIETPLVYHLHGSDTYPQSLVLTEDDYLDFLVKVSQDIEVIPPKVGRVLADSSLLLLGYSLRSWDFRVIFRGMINAKAVSRRPKSLSIQLLQSKGEEMEGIKEVRLYLQQYFKEYKFDVYWGDTQRFIKDLWEQWELA